MEAHFSGTPAMEDRASPPPPLSVCVLSFGVWFCPVLKQVDVAALVSHKSV